MNPECVLSEGELMMACRAPSGSTVTSLISRPRVIEGLIMRQSLGRTENVNRSRHISMNQARQLEIARNREIYGEGASLYQRWSGHACRAIERSGVGREPGTPHKER